ncbi:MAG: hypothetical protein MRY32_09215 [Rickettsiales bacterium]|nr:hypothetical protein [Rickettsiales bacterium]
MEAVKKSSWAKEYYEIVEYYFWEPQHIGRQKNPNTKYVNAEMALDHVRNLEVSLNHIINIFFRLAPDNFINRMLEKYYDHQTDDAFVFTGREELRDIYGATQPDVYFVGKDTTLSIELKLAAKTSPDQLAKYAVLNSHVEKLDNRPRKHFLLYMTPSGRVDKLAPKLSTYEAIKTAISDEGIAKVLKRAKLKEDLISQVREYVGLSHFEITSYEAFSSFLRQEKAASRESTFKKLVDGIVSEFAERGLV